MQLSLDPILSLFNETVGQEKGIIVVANYYNVPRTLDQDIYEAALGKVGSRLMPDMFCAYPNNAYRINAIRPLVDFNKHFTKEERDEFFPPFLDYGTINGQWLLMPVTKSSEALFVNKTGWDVFAKETGSELASLTTWEGLVATAAAYYDWTNAKTPEPNDGRSFMSVDYAYNMLLMAERQRSHSVFSEKNGKTVLHIDKQAARRIWENYHVPHIRGYFRNDFVYTVYNIKQEVTLAGITTTAFGGLQFPPEVTPPGKNAYSIDAIVLPYPVFEGGKPCAPLRGGQDVCVVSKDDARTYASIEFLKWFTDVQRNLEFTVPKGYLPVKQAALDQVALHTLRSNENNGEDNEGALSTQIALDMLYNAELYRNKPFSGDIELEQAIADFLPNAVSEALYELRQRVLAGEERHRVIEDLISDARFEAWHGTFMKVSQSILSSAQKAE